MGAVYSQRGEAAGAGDCPWFSGRIGVFPDRCPGPGAASRTPTTGVGKLHAVLGGVHLFPASDEYLQRSVAELKALNPDVVIPMHCSGPGFVTAVREQMPDRLVTSTTGTEFTFGA